LFLLTLVCLHLLCAGDPELTARAFETRIMDLLGYMPYLDGCVNCGQPLTGTGITFSSRLGGGLCEVCNAQDRDSIACSMGTLNMLKQLSKWDIRRLNVLKMNGNVRREIGEIMSIYIMHRLEKKLKSADFIRTLSSVQIIG
jgi:DNA repair protein RecO (recombination protein O)